MITCALYQLVLLTITSADMYDHQARTHAELVNQNQTMHMHMCVCVAMCNCVYVRIIILCTIIYMCVLCVSIMWVTNVGQHSSLARHTHTHTHMQCLTCTHTQTYTNIHTVTHTVSLSLTHTHTHTHTLHAGGGMSTMLCMTMLDVGGGSITWFWCSYSRPSRVFSSTAIIFL